MTEAKRQEKKADLINVIFDFERMEQRKYNG